MKKKSYIYVISSVCLVIVLSIIAFSFAKWFTTREQKNTNILGSSCLDTTINESDSITLNNLYPVTDQEGMNGKYYEFKLTNNCDITEDIEINLELFSTTSSFNANQIKYSLNNSTPVLISSKTKITPIITNATSGYKLASDTLTKGQTKTYILRMWINENETVESATNKTLKSKISVITSYKK